ncbi:MAG: LptF/LptG family permease [Verrucomicrobiales bacterium]
MLSVLGGALAAWLVPLEQAAVSEHLNGFPDADARSQHLRPAVLAFICFIPALGALYYASIRALDRYLLRQFLSSLAVCFLALYAIWLIIDLSDNLSDFSDGNAPLSFIVRYYALQFPYAFIELIPFTLLLALLYSLGKISKNREIIGMIQTGRGITRIILPIVVIGFLLGTLCLGFNYHWAPWVSGYQDALIEQVNSGTSSKARNVLFHERESGRLWFIGSFPHGYTRGEALGEVEIRTFNSDHTPHWKLRAKSASWNPETAAWHFHEATVTHLDRRLYEGGPLLPVYEKSEKPLVFRDWKETPWQLIKPGLTADQLGIPDLISWLRENENASWANKRPFLTQWHYRWAQPWICLAIILLAAPLGIVFSRRGAGGGIAMALFLAVSLMFSSTVFLALGEANYLPPALAAWGTNLLALGLALVFLQRRLTGRPIYQTLKKLLPGGE